MTSRLKAVLPKSLWKALRTCKHTALRGFRYSAEAVGLVIARKADYHNPLPSEFELCKSLARWDRPSALRGVHYDLDAFRQRLSSLMTRYYEEFNQLPPFTELTHRGFGHGFPLLDALILYAMVRDLKPKRYLEVGCGLSTYYAWLAAQKNAAEGHPVAITCIEPYPFAALATIEGVKVIQALAQDVSVDVFSALERGDILFIDSTHIVRIDGDVPYLFLEVLPALKPGVQVHVHDIPFPYNTPYPANCWVLVRDPASNHWPVYWTEPMLLQAFLAFNPRYSISLSCPMLRHFDPAALAQTIPGYDHMSAGADSFSSIWLEVGPAFEHVFSPTR
ncbi:MAG: class I SAM-dependent methyltransferase [Verrucomicrobia bacterium]|nr:class I SAM-dependent methyltransferase [Verrucomicrobiota bacterium]